jgi:hypothetical protein
VQRRQPSRGLRPPVPGHAAGASTFPPGIESFIGIAIRTYDGEGQFTQISNVKGAVIGVEADVESTGTYQVNEDCSGSDTLQPFEGAPIITDRLVIVDDGRQVRIAVMTPVAIVNTGVMERIHNR